MNGLPFQDLRCQEQILEGRVGAAADGHLVHRERFDFTDLFHRVGAVRAGCQRLQIRQIQGDFIVIRGAGVGPELSPAAFAPL